MLRSSVVAALAAAAAPAQLPPVVPYPRTLDLLVADSLADRVWRIGDRNQNGDYDDPGEITTFYDDVNGSIPLTNPTCIAVATDGRAYLGDSTTDQILVLRDNNGDGDANDAGEHAVFFDSATNASSVTMASVMGITVTGTGSLLLAVAGTTGGGSDIILRLDDLNADGDANDPGEARIYCTIPNSGGMVGDSIPTKVVVGWNTRVYYADVGATGVVTKGVWELFDANMDGDCDDPGEVNLYWTPPAPGNAFYWGLAVDASNRLWVSDHGNETIWTARDADGDGRITPAEEQLFYQTSGSTWWDLVLRDDGVLLVCEDETPDRIVGLRDMNGDGDAMDPGESFDAYSELTSPTDIQRPRAAAFYRAPLLAAVPGQVRIGGMTTLRATATKAADLVGVLVAAGSRTTPLPPYGILELDPLTLTPVAVGFAGADARLDLPFAVPNNARLAGVWPFQAVSGDPFRLYLSELRPLTVTR